MALEHSNWTGRTEGTPWMHRKLIGALRIMPLWFVYLGMALFVVPWCMLFGRRGYLAQMRLFRLRLGCGPWRAFWNTYKNHVRFGQVIIDRFAAYAGKQFQFDLHGYDHFLNLCDQPEGIVVLSAHVGNYELAGYAFKAMKKPMCALVFGGEAKAVMENRNRLLGGNNIEMVPVSEDMSHLFALNNRLAEGQIVSLPADRTFGSKRTLTCQLLGAEVHLPLGPFRLATSRQVPVLTIFVMKTGIRKYRVEITQLNASATAEKHADQALADAFAAQLEQTVRQFPTQWFNYYDFWKAQ